MKLNDNQLLAFYRRFLHFYQDTNELSYQLACKELARYAIKIYNKSKSDSLKEEKYFAGVN